MEMLVQNYLSCIINWRYFYVKHLILKNIFQTKQNIYPRDTCCKLWVDTDKLLSTHALVSFLNLFREMILIKVGSHRSQGLKVCFYYLKLCRHVSVWLCRHEYRCPWNPKETTWPAPETGVTGGLTWVLRINSTLLQELCLPLDVYHLCSPEKIMVFITSLWDWGRDRY